MINRRFLASEAIYDLVNFSLLYGLLIIPLMFVAEIGIGWMLLGLLLLAYNFVIRTYVRNTVLMIIGHIIILPPIIWLVLPFINNLWIAISAACMLVALLIYSLALRTKSKIIVEISTGVFKAIALTVMCFIAMHFNLSGAAIVYPILVAVTLIGNEMYRRISRVDNSLEVITKTSTQPVKQILKFDHKAMFVLGFILILLTAVAYFAVLNPLLTQISNIQIGRRDVQWGSAPYIPIPLPQAPAGGMDLHELLEPREPHPILAFLHNITYILAQIAIAVISIVVLFAIIISIYRNLKHKQKSPHFIEGEDEKEFIVPASLKPTMKNLLDYFHWNEDKTRKTFCKKLQRHRKLGTAINKAQSPEEIAQAIQASAKPEDISDLIDAYRKVRY